MPRTSVLFTPSAPAHVTPPDLPPQLSPARHHRERPARLFPEGLRRHAPSAHQRGAGPVPMALPERTDPPAGRNPPSASRIHTDGAGARHLRGLAAWPAAAP